jgi:hypothetical protein
VKHPHRHIKGRVLATVRERDTGRIFHENSHALGNPVDPADVPNSLVLEAHDLADADLVDRMRSVNPIYPAT